MGYYALNYCPLCKRNYNHKELFPSDYSEKNPMPTCDPQICDNCQ